MTGIPGEVIVVHLIVTEKNISAERIAKILAGREKIIASRDGGIASYRFNDTVITGLRGHVVEVDFEPGYNNWRSETHTPRSLIDAGTVKVPTEKKIIHLIQKLAKKADMVTIATDFDTEGELIGKEAYELIRAVNPKVRVDRARFSAITPDEIRQAFANTTEIDFALAAAGEARQVIDLMWGASLTRFISLAARRGGANILSVGRVQSPTLAMLVDREKEIEAFVPETVLAVISPDRKRRGNGRSPPYDRAVFRLCTGKRGVRQDKGTSCCHRNKRRPEDRPGTRYRSTPRVSSLQQQDLDFPLRTPCGSPKTCI